MFFKGRAVKTAAGTPGSWNITMRPPGTELHYKDRGRKRKQHQGNPSRSNQYFFLKGEP